MVLTAGAGVRVRVGVGVGVRSIHYHHSQTLTVSLSHLAQLVLQGWDILPFMYYFTTDDPICLAWHTYGIMEFFFCWIL